MSSFQKSTQQLLITEQTSPLVTSNSILSTQSQPNQLKFMGTGSLFLVYSSKQCNSFSRIEKESSSGIEMTSHHTSHPPMQTDRVKSLVLTRPSENSQGQSTMCHLTNLRSLDFSRCGMSSVKLQVNRWDKKASEVDRVDGEAEDPHGGLTELKVATALIKLHIDFPYTCRVLRFLEPCPKPPDIW